ncbi:MAG: HD domain-containing protein [Bacteroidales bacterium]|nr:HD domain-containing protein [Bacteroidales bacterium]
MTNKRKIINDPVYGFLTIEDDVIFDVISHPYFQRERNIKQLAFTYYVYPGATHSRFSHMLGALNLMNRAIEVLKVKGVQISDEEAVGVKLAILLHDIGHGPFSHTLEHTLVDVDHEKLTSLFMQRINSELDGRLSLAIEIFEDRYPKHFLHQLVSSQLDMDRLDYLSRDSFFSGVSEGIVGTERIINMLNVHKDELVVDEKGVYSIEKFIISRRLMYWQVYLHKTVIACDTLLHNILKRARYLISHGGITDRNGNPIIVSLALSDFLSHHYSEQDFYADATLLDRFAQLDDADIMVAVKAWIFSSDKVLGTLANQLVSRKLPAIRISYEPYTPEMVATLQNRAQLLYALSPEESAYFVGTGKLENHAYNFNDQEISVRFKNGKCLDISEASDQLDRPFLEKSVKKYYIFFPKELTL